MTHTDLAGATTDAHRDSLARHVAALLSSGVVTLAELNDLSENEIRVLMGDTSNI